MVCKKYFRVLSPDKTEHTLLLCATHFESGIVNSEKDYADTESYYTS